MNKDTTTKKFFWGSSTAAHQIEGGNINSWTEWEQKSARSKKQEASGKKWPEYILNHYPNPLQEENYISGHASDHYYQYKGDIELAHALGHNSFRFSVEWSRIEQEEGRWNEKEVEHYRAVIAELKNREMEPFVTLWHWTLPLWLVEKGGVCATEFPKYFTRYAEKIASAFGDDVRYWITLNEPNVYTSHGYLNGSWPPGKRSLGEAMRAYRTLQGAHKEAYAVIKNRFPGSHVGITQNLIWFTGLLAPFKNYFWNKLFFNRIRGSQDFIGVNYYFSDKNKKERTDMGWPIDPVGLYVMLHKVKRYGKPIYIIENGIADARDTMRGQFIRDHIRVMQKAMSEGIDVRGYFYWSLLDNFEWDKGFWPRFGLIEVDYKTYERKVRKSAWEYKALIEESQ